MTQGNSLILNFISNLPAFLTALVVHEYAHGFVAHKFGDNTAKYMGRLTINPFAHIDLFGTILLPLFLILSHSPIVLGWAKPVPVNFLNLHNPKKNMIWVGLAGPAANFITAALTFLILKIKVVNQLILIDFLMNILIINLILGLFNLIPIPPLDGSRVLMGILPLKIAVRYNHLEPYGMFILILLLIILRHLLL